MNEFAEFYTIEVYGPKGWEVLQTHDVGHSGEALYCFGECMNDPSVRGLPLRFTTPMVTTESSNV